MVPEAMENQEYSYSTGAGISAESGIRTFRAADGLWEEHRVEDGQRRKVLIAILNWCKRFITPVVDSCSSQKFSLTLHILRWRNCKMLWRSLLLVTQNIDNLHERAGNTNVIHMHGELLKVRCSQSGGPRLDRRCYARR